MDAKLRAKLETIRDLPTLPTVVLEMTRLLADPTVSARRLCEKLEKDQAVTSKILRLVNSPFYGFSGKIASLSHALALLGLNVVRNAVISISAMNAFGGERRRVEALWRHSIGCGVLARRLSWKLGLPQAEDAFVTGLLHDIGKVFCASYLQDEFASILSLMETEGRSVLEAEEDVLGSDHSQIGGYLAGQWRLPADLTESILYHHRPRLAESNPDLVCAVHLADIICHGLGLGGGQESLVPELDRDAWERLGLRLATIEELLPVVEREYEAARSAFLN
jgi:HD-like signal output (HDOD) protein